MNGLGTVCCWGAQGLDSGGKCSWFWVSSLEFSFKILGFSIVRLICLQFGVHGAGFQDLTFRISRLLFSRCKVSNDRIWVLRFMFEDLGFEVP